jgi:hypothetical protein
MIAERVRRIQNAGSNGGKGLLTFQTGLILVIVLSLVFIVGAWDGQTDQTLMDAGRTLYAPELVLRGRTAYRDFDWMYAPLSPYLDALVYRVAGVRYDALQAWGCGLFFLIIVLLYQIGAILATPLPALAVIVPFILFSDCWLGFVPYSFAATYANLAGLLAFALLARPSRDGSPWRIAAAGVAVGFCCLSKLEFGLGALLGGAAYLTACRGTASQRRWFFGSAVATALPPYLALLRSMPMGTLVSQLFPFWLAKIYHFNLLQTPGILVLPASCAIVLLLALFRPGLLLPDDAPNERRPLMLGFMTFGLIITLRGLQGSWFINMGPPLIAISLLSAVLIRRLARFFASKKAEEIVQSLFLLFFLGSVGRMMQVVIDNRIDFNYTLRNPRLEARFYWGVGQLLDQTTGFFESQNLSQNLIAMPYMPVFNFLTRMDSPAPRLFYLKGFLPDAAAENEVIRDLEKAGGAWIVTSNIYDEKQPCGFTGCTFGVNYDLVIWSYLQRNYVTCAVWKDGKLSPVPHTRPRSERYAILAPRRWFDRAPSGERGTAHEVSR